MTNKAMKAAGPSLIAQNFVSYSSKEVVKSVMSPITSPAATQPI